MIKKKVDKKTNLPKKILVTAGPTVEPLDPVRYISNYSTGTMGYKIASQGVKKGFKICLVSGPVHLPPPHGAEMIIVTRAREMRDRVIERIDEYDCLIMTAAVCDFRPQEEGKRKIKKKNTLNLKLVKNPDILMEVRQNKDLIKIGFALETENAVKNGKKKLEEKKLDLIVVNTVTEQKNPFGTGVSDYTTIDKSGKTKDFKAITKGQMAEVIIDEAEKLMS